MSYNPKFIFGFNYIRNKPTDYCLVRMEARVVSPNIASSMILIKADRYELNQTFYYKLKKKTLLNEIQQIRRGSSWKPNKKKV